MKLGSPIQEKKARIEIIPLIDIMFFLLAVMMMVSLGLVKVNAIKINLPTTQTATEENKSDFVTLSVKPTGETYIGKDFVPRDELVERLKQIRQDTPDVRIFVQGDAEAVHGDIMLVLDRIRAAGIQRIGFQTKKQEVVSATGTEREAVP